MEPRPIATRRGRQVWFFCPGCNEMHFVFVDPSAAPKPVWTWNQSLTSPTFSPSLLVRGVHTCHSFIEIGTIRYLCDCTHNLAGQIVPIPPIPEWFPLGEDFDG